MESKEIPVRSVGKTIPMAPVAAAKKMFHGAVEATQIRLSDEEEKKFQETVIAFNRLRDHINQVGVAVSSLREGGVKLDALPFMENAESIVKGQNFSKMISDMRKHLKKRAVKALK